MDFLLFLFALGALSYFYITMVHVLSLYKQSIFGDSGRWREQADTVFSMRNSCFKYSFANVRGRGRKRIEVVKELFICQLSYSLLPLHNKTPRKLIKNTYPILKHSAVS